MIKSKYFLLLFSVFCLLGVNVDSVSAQGLDNTKGDVVEVLYNTPPKIYHVEQNPFDYGATKFTRIRANGYVYEGTLRKVKSNSWLFRYEGYLYKTQIPSVLNVDNSVTE